MIYAPSQASRDSKIEFEFELLSSVWAARLERLSNQRDRRGQIARRRACTALSIRYCSPPASASGIGGGPFATRKSSSNSNSSPACGGPPRATL